MILLKLQRRKIYLYILSCLIFCISLPIEAVIQTKWFESKGFCSKSQLQESEDLKTCAVKKAKEKVIILAIKELGISDEEADQAIKDYAISPAKFIHRFEVSSRSIDQGIEITLSAAILLEELRQTVEPIIKNEIMSSNVTLFILPGINDSNNTLSSEFAKKLEPEFSAQTFFEKGIPSFQESPSWFSKNSPVFNNMAVTAQLLLEQKNDTNRHVEVFTLKLQLVLYQKNLSSYKIQSFAEQGVSNFKSSVPDLLLNSLVSQAKDFLLAYSKQKSDISDNKIELIFRQKKAHTLLPMRDYLQNLNSYFSSVKSVSIAKLNFDGFTLLVSLRGHKANFIEELKKNFTPMHSVEVKEKIIITSLAE